MVIRRNVLPLRQSLPSIAARCRVWNGAGPQKRRRGMSLFSKDIKLGAELTTIGAKMVKAKPGKNDDGTKKKMVLVIPPDNFLFFYAFYISGMIKFYSKREKRIGFNKR